MLSRRPWITAFTGHVLRRGHAVDPDWAFDTAGDLYLDWREVTPEFAADSAFDPRPDASAVCHPGAVRPGNRSSALSCDAGVLRLAAGGEMPE
jgi:hypothetical protein